MSAEAVTTEEKSAARRGKPKAQANLRVVSGVQIDPSRDALLTDFGKKTLDELANGGFQLMIPDSTAKGGQKVSRVVLCSGKVYYDLHEERERLATDKVALVRVEQLYPFPSPQLAATLARYPNASELLWVQEEPKNMGAWTFVRPLLEDLLAPLAARAFLDQAEAMRLVEAAGRIEPPKCPQVAFGEVPPLAEGDSLGQQAATNSTAAHPVVDDEPA